MSKRTVVVALLAVLLALSSTVYAVMPEKHSAPVEGKAVALFLSVSDEEPIDNPPSCPDPTNPACGG